MAVMTIIFLDEKQTGRRHILGSNGGEAITAFDVCCEVNGEFRLLRESLHQQPVIPLARLHVAVPILKLECLASGITVHAATLDPEAFTSAARQAIRVDTNALIFLRDNDLVTFHYESHVLSLTINISDGPVPQEPSDVTVQVGSSLPPQSSIAHLHADAPPNNVANIASAEAFTSTPAENSPTPNPSPAKSNPVVQETPSTQRYRNGLVAPETEERSQAITQNETQFKNEEESQLRDDFEQPSTTRKGVANATQRDNPVDNIVDSFQEPLRASSLRDSSPDVVQRDDSVELGISEQVDAIEISKAESKPRISDHLTASAGLEVFSTAAEDSNSPSVGVSETRGPAPSPHSRRPSIDRNDQSPEETESELESEQEDPARVDGGYKEAIHTQEKSQHSRTSPASPKHMIEIIPEGSSSPGELLDREVGTTDVLFPTAQPSFTKVCETVSKSPQTSSAAQSRKRKLPSEREEQQPAQKKPKTPVRLVQESPDNDSDSEVIERPAVSFAVVINNMPSIEPVVSRTPQAIRSLRKKKAPITYSKKSATRSITPVRRPSASPSISSSADSVASRTRGTKSRGVSDTSSASPSANYKSPRVGFSNSNYQQMPDALKFLRAQGGRVIEKLGSGFDVMVIGKGEIKRTPKLLTAVALGKTVTTDDWLAASARADSFLDPVAYTPSDPGRQKAWRFTFNDGKDRHGLFQSKTIMITPTLKKDYGVAFRVIEQLLQKTGAKDIISKSAKSVQLNDSTIIVAVEQDDIDAIELQSRGVICYTKDFLSTSILRGEIELESDEFKVKAVLSPTGPRKKGRPRKSG